MVVTHVGSSEPDKDFYADLDKAKHRPSCFSCGGCLGLFFLIILLLVVGAASVVAASGIATVPVLSGMLYKTDPLPTRVVEAATAADIGTLIASKQQAAAGGALELTEGELTAALREPTQSGAVTLKRGQIAIDASRAEVYGQVSPGEYGKPVILRAEFSPAGNNQLELTRVRIGYVEVPIKIARSLGSTLLRQDIGSSRSLGRFGVTGISLSSGSALVTLDPTTLLERAGDQLSAQTQELLQSAGIDPKVLSQNLTKDQLVDLAGRINTLTADQTETLKAAIPELKRLDQ